jgi:hypothetical protein
MTGYIIAIITSMTSFIGAFIASALAIKNTKKEHYFVEKKKLYYELAMILPDIEEFIAQSDYMTGDEGNCSAEEKVNIMKIRLEDAEDRKKNIFTREQILEVEQEIRMLKYKIDRNNEYIKQNEQLRCKIDEFEKNGNKNLLRIFASAKVWRSYVRFKVALHNEYYCCNGVKKEDIIVNIMDLLKYMSKDLSGGSK